MCGLFGVHIDDLMGIALAVSSFPAIIIYTALSHHMSLYPSSQAVDQRYSLSSITSNKQKLQRLQDVMSLSLGIAAGVLGLESLGGFAFYLVGIIASDLSFLAICCQNSPGNFFVSPVKEVILEGLFTSLAGYVMMWCMTYALVK